jgi:hypothetical protein
MEHDDREQDDPEHNKLAILFATTGDVGCGRMHRRCAVYRSPPISNPAMTQSSLADWRAIRYINGGAHVRFNSEP